MDTVGTTQRIHYAPSSQLKRRGAKTLGNKCADGSAGLVKHLGLGRWSVGR
jgi:hypothetical protein